MGIAFVSNNVPFDAVQRSRKDWKTSMMPYIFFFGLEPFQFMFSAVVATPTFDSVPGSYAVMQLIWAGDSLNFNYLCGREAKTVTHSSLGTQKTYLTIYLLPLEEITLDILARMELSSARGLPPDID